jgi:hypothetical protein
MTTDKLREGLRRLRSKLDEPFSYKGQKPAVIERVDAIREEIDALLADSAVKKQGPCSCCGDGDTAMEYHTHDSAVKVGATLDVQQVAREITELKDASARGWNRATYEEDELQAAWHEGARNAYELVLKEYLVAAPDSKVTRCNRCQANLCKHDNCTDWTCARACSKCASTPDSKGNGPSADVVREAVLAERRACAEIADDCKEQVYGPYGVEFVQSDAAIEIARRIRERE